MEALRALGHHLANCHCGFALFVGAFVALAALALGRVGAAHSLTIEVRQHAKPNLKN